jgi:hypothetical protein
MTKDELIEKYRYWNVEDFDWWDCTYDDFKVSMTAVGIRVDRMYFSGFCSQGDGACFEGHVEDWGLFLQSLGYDSPALLALADTGWRFSVTHSGHYYHQNCTSFTVCMNTLDCNDAIDNKEFAEVFSPYKSDLQTAAWMAVIAAYSRDTLVEQFTEAFKGHMRELYKDLEAEHDYLTSDEVVWESLEANDMTDELNQPEEETT